MTIAFAVWLIVHNPGLFFFLRHIFALKVEHWNS